MDKKSGVSDEQLGKISRRQIDLLNNVIDGSCEYEHAMDGLKNIIEGKTVADVHKLQIANSLFIYLLKSTHIFEILEALSRGINRVDEIVSSTGVAKKSVIGAFYVLCSDGIVIRKKLAKVISIF